MSIFRGTKGPWSQGTRGPNGCPIIGNGKGLMVAMIAHSANEPGQEIEAEANAKLIAASPNLLNALKTVVGLLQHKATSPLEIEAIRFGDLVIAQATQ